MGTKQLIGRSNDSKESMKDTINQDEESGNTVKSEDTEKMFLDNESKSKIIPIPNTDELESEKESFKNPRNLDDISGVRDLKSFLESNDRDETEENASRSLNDSSVSKAGSNPYNKDDDVKIDEVEMQKMSDEELVCFNNLRKLTGIFKAKIAINQDSKYESRYETRTFEKVEETQETIALELGNVKSAVQKKKVIIIQQTIITIVQSVSNWLDRVEYRISTVKRLKTVNQKKEE